MNGTGSGLCSVVVFSIRHAHSFVSVGRELVSSCFMSQIPVKGI
jgi:hypothetical protein